MSEDIKVVTTYDIENIEILEHIGLVQGSTVRSRNFGADVFATLKNVIGGELVGYSKLLKTSRDQAYARMLEDAKSKITPRKLRNLCFTTFPIENFASTSSCIIFIT